MAILKKYKFNNPYFILSRNDRWDLELCPDSTYANIPLGLCERCLISYINIEDNKCIENNKLFSMEKYKWQDAENNGVDLYDIGLTGIDNGFINFRKDRISNQEFYNILTNSHFHINENDNRLFLSPVTGNTLEYTYEYDINEGYISLKGGFFQGFFKLYGFNYQVLPDKIENSCSLEFTIRKRDYKTDDKILNKINPDNSGIFFYIGTRAENKFWDQYNTNVEQFDNNNKIDYYSDSYLNDQSDYNLDISNIIYSDYFNEDLEEDKVITDKNYLLEPDYIDEKKCQLLSNYDFSLDPYVIWDNNSSNNLSNKENNNNAISKSHISEYFLNEYGYAQSNNCPCYCKQNEKVDKKCITHIIPNPFWYTRFETDICTTNNICNETEDNNHGCGPCDSYYLDEYYDEFNNGCCTTEGYLIDSDYFMPEVSLKDVLVTTSEGHPINETGYYEFTSDNKFLLFNHTKTGYTASNYIEGLSITFTGRTSSFKGNFYLLLNHTKTGYTVDSIDKLLSKYENTYDVIGDIVNNAFALRITPDNAIGYRYLINNCDDEKTFEIVEEYSKPNVFPFDKWNVINVVFKIIDNVSYNIKNNRKLKLYFYINGFLVFISKEIPELKLKQLADTFEKQECVPYNISLGGGTQGLSEKIWLNYYEIPKKILPLEKYFAGTFIGDFKSFKFYNCKLNFNEIKNNFIYENNQ